ncbi:MAG: ATP-binding protein [bacterium]|nr:ATP-binding protein [bacterium]
MRIERKLFKRLMASTESRKTVVIIGPRQSGKTTLLKMIRDLVLEQGHKNLFLDIDLFSDFEKIATYENIINTLKLHGFKEGGQEPFYLFLDEFQRYEDLSIILKNLYDHQENLKVYATGSSSLTVKQAIQESLAGRKLLYNLYPLDFEEFLEFHDDPGAVELYRNSAALEGKNLSPIVDQLTKYLQEFMVFGGYPEVVLTRNPKEKQEVLRSIFDLYVKKELVEYLKIEKVYPVKLIIEYLAINNGQKLKYDELAKISGLPHKTIRHYLDILEETFLIRTVRPFFTNRNKEIVKIPKVYFIDPGVANYFIKNFNPLELRKDAGFLFENVMVGEMVKQGFGPSELKFWGDKNQREVDLVIDTPSQLMGMELKYKKKLKEVDFTGLRAFDNMYRHQNPELFLVNIGAQYIRDNIRVCLPFHSLFDI